MQDGTGRLADALTDSQQILTALNQRIIAKNRNVAAAVTIFDGTLPTVTSNLTNSARASTSQNQHEFNATKYTNKFITILERLKTKLDEKKNFYTGILGKILTAIGIYNSKLVEARLAVVNSLETELNKRISANTDLEPAVLKTSLDSFQQILSSQIASNTAANHARRILDNQGEVAESLDATNTQIATLKAEVDQAIKDQPSVAGAIANVLGLR